MDNESAIITLAALAQSTRLETFKALVTYAPDGLPAGELARLLGIPQNTMSAHLATLSRANLVSSHRQQRSIIYRINLAHFQELILFMIKDCCKENEELCKPLLENLLPCCLSEAERKGHNVNI